MRLRVKFNKRNYLKYISHLDLMRLFQRTFNRAKVPVKYSQGFNPQPRFSIAHPLPVATESQEEYMDIELVEAIKPADFINRMNEILPKDIQIIDCLYPEDKQAIAAMVSLALYEISFDSSINVEEENLPSLIENWLGQDQIIISRYRKRGRRKILVEEDVKALIKALSVTGTRGKTITIQALLGVGEGGNLRTSDFMGALARDNEGLGIDMDSIQYKRIGLFIEKDGKLIKPIW